MGLDGRGAGAWAWMMRYSHASPNGKRCLALNVRPRLLGAGLAAGDEVEDRGAEVGEPLLADALAAEQGGW